MFPFDDVIMFCEKVVSCGICLVCYGICEMGLFITWARYSPT